MDKGEVVDKGSGRVRVYPYNQDMMLRDRQSTLEELLKASESGEASMGVKGHSNPICWLVLI